MKSWRAERIGLNVDKILRGDADAHIAADQFNLDANIYGRVLSAMQQGDVAMRIDRVTKPEAQQTLTQIADLFDFVNSSIKEIFEGSPALLSSLQANTALLDNSPILLEALADTSDKITLQESLRQPNNLTILAPGIAAVISSALIGLQLFLGTRRRWGETAETTGGHRTTTLRLRDEPARSAAGYLTA